VQRSFAQEDSVDFDKLVDTRIDGCGKVSVENRIPEALKREHIFDDLAIF
jgi:hypothetical protein